MYLACLAKINYFDLFVVSILEEVQQSHQFFKFSMQHWASYILKIQVGNSLHLITSNFKKI